MARTLEYLMSWTPGEITEDDEIEGAMRCEIGLFGNSVPSSHGLRSTDLALSAESEPPLGAHIVTPRRGYTHHGIYVGHGRVVQYGGLSRGLRRGPVEEVSLSEFAQGRPIHHRPGESVWFDRHEVVRRARMRLGENRYNVLTNNCEHFCEWCVRGEHRSYQVDDLMVRCSRAWRGLAEVLGRSTFPRRGSAVRASN